MADIITDLRRGARQLVSSNDALATQLTGRNRVLMMLGQFMFSVASAVPQTITHRASYKWPSQDVIGREPVLQYLGPGARSIELPGRIYPYYKGGLKQVQAMNQLAGLGEVQLLVDALGNIHGDFAITEVEETQSVFDASNAPRRIDFRMKLARASA